MPYVCIQTSNTNRYLGEHACGQHHYGDMALIRPCCVEDARKWRATTLNVAMTIAHPAYTLFRAAQSCLTDAERRIVGDIRTHGVEIIGEEA